MSPTSPLYHVGNARTAQQALVMLRLEAAGICLFCPEHLRGRQHVEHATAHWTVTANAYPYANTAKHLLLIPDEHACDLVDLTPAVQADFWAALAWVRERHGLTHYGLGARNGDCGCTGASIVHVHVHVLVGDVTKAEHRPVRMSFSAARGHAQPRPTNAP